MSRVIWFAIIMWIAVTTLVTDLPGQELPCDSSDTFIRGDANRDGFLSIIDPIVVLGYLYQGRPVGEDELLAAYDANGNNVIALSDALRVCDYLFADGAAPPAPFPSLGLDPRCDDAIEELMVEIDPSRTSGVAPLPVFFDALGTELLSGTKHDAFYEWDFGDTSSSRNSAYGFCAAHVFEAAGTYEATVAVTDSAGNVGSATVTIEVEAFSGISIYVSNDGDDTDAGTSTSAPLETFEEAMQRLDDEIADSADGVRVLFKRGDEFETDSSGGSLPRGVGGPAIIGAYGSGARPILRATGNNTLFSVGRDDRGWRIVDIDARGVYDYDTDSGSPADAIACGGAKNVLVLRCNLEGWDMGVNTASSGYDTEEIFLFDSAVLGSKYYGVIFEGVRLVAIGNRIERVADEHVLRVGGLQRGVISDNSLLDAPKHALKMHSLGLESDGMHSHDIVISGNSFRAGAWVVQIAPQNGTDFADEEVRDVVFEKNIILPNSADSSGSNTSLGLHLVAHDVTIRNNAFLASTEESGYTAVSVDAYDASSLPNTSNINILNNTYWNGADSGDWSGARFTRIGKASVQEVRVINNIMSAPLAGDEASFIDVPSGFELAELSDGFNLLDLAEDGCYLRDGGDRLTVEDAAREGLAEGVVAASANLSDPERLDLCPAGDSPAVDAGTFTAAVRDDIGGNLRSPEESVDIGCCESDVP